MTVRTKSLWPAAASGARRVLPIAVAVAVAIGTVGMLATGAAAQSITDDLPSGIKALLPQAKQEGSVSFYNGSTRIEQSQAAVISKAFEAKFGFPMNVIVAGIGPHAPVAQRIRTEFQKGVKPPFDVHATTARLLVTVREVGAIEQVDWPALGVPEGRLLPTMDGFLISTIPRTVTYNTKLVSKEEAPRRLEDLLDPKWKGKIVAPAFGGAFAYLIPVLGEQQTYDFVRKLINEQKIVLARSFTEVVQKVANGEYKLGFGVPADLSGLRRRGAPIENAPLQKVSGANVYGAVLKNADHPAAAKVFLYFACCTPEGQKIAADVLSVATFDTPGTEAAQIGGEGRGVLPQVDWMIQDEERVVGEIEKILGL
jgi:iron(III) transport system substrate-binding protein